MSNYLSQMATLAVNRAPVVQPRLASRFEGSVGAAPAEDMQEQVAQPPASRPAAAPAEIPTAAKTPQREQAAAPIPVPVAQPTAPLLQSQPGALPRPSVSEPVAPATPVVEPQRLVQELIRERIHEQPLLVPASAPQGSAPTRSESLIIEKHSEHSFTEIHHEMAAPIAAERQPATAKDGSKQEAPATLATPPQIHTRIAVREPIMQSALRQPASTTEPNSPAPSIQISIGRIEIRATPASSSALPKAQAAKSATLSLDDYLKQRKGDR